MRLRDALQPGERLFLFGDADDQVWSGEVGDVVVQSGPRIGIRRWLVTHVDHKRRWSHVVCRASSRDEEVRARADATVWYMHSRRITPESRS